MQIIVSDFAVGPAITHKIKCRAWRIEVDAVVVVSSVSRERDLARALSRGRSEDSKSKHRRAVVSWNCVASVSTLSVRGQSGLLGASADFQDWDASSEGWGPVRRNGRWTGRGSGTVPLEPIALEAKARTQSASRWKLQSVFLIAQGKRCTQERESAADMLLDRSK